LVVSGGVHSLGGSALNDQVTVVKTADREIGIATCESIFFSLFEGIVSDPPGIRDQLLGEANVNRIGARIQQGRRSFGWRGLVDTSSLRGRGQFGSADWRAGVVPDGLCG
jgi:hypothetical protein